MNDGATICRVCEAETDAYLCRGCGRYLEDALAEITALMHEVSVAATRQSRVYRSNRQRQDADGKWVTLSGHPSVSPDGWLDEERNIPAFLRSPQPRTALSSTPMPVDLSMSDLLWVAGNTLSTWTRHVAEFRGLDLPTPRGMVVWLTGHASAFRFDVDGPQAFDELTHLHSQLMRAVDRSPSRIYVGPCHAALDNGKCQRDLYAKPGAAEIVCDGFATEDATDIGCQTTHTAAERRSWLVDELEDALVPLETLKAAIPQLYPDRKRPTPSTWRSWQFRRRLVPYGVDIHGQELYRGGDVLDLISAMPPKTSDRPGTMAG